MAGAPIHHLRDVVPQGSLPGLVVFKDDMACLANSHLSRQRGASPARFQVAGIVIPAGESAALAETFGMGYGGCQVVDFTRIGDLGRPSNG